MAKTQTTFLRKLAIRHPDKFKAFLEQRFKEKLQNYTIENLVAEELGPEVGCLTAVESDWKQFMYEHYGIEGPAPMGGGSLFFMEGDDGRKT